jgi:hypothetical protein
MQAVLCLYLRAKTKLRQDTVCLLVVVYRVIRMAPLFCSVILPGNLAIDLGFPPGIRSACRDLSTVLRNGRSERDVSAWTPGSIKAPGVRVSLPTRPFTLRDTLVLVLATGVG